MSTADDIARQYGHATIPLAPADRSITLCDYVRKMHQLGRVEFDVTVDPANPIAATVKRRGFDSPKDKTP